MVNSFVKKHFLTMSTNLDIRAILDMVSLVPLLSIYL